MSLVASRLGGLSRRTISIATRSAGAALRSGALGAALCAVGVPRALGTGVSTLSLVSRLGALGTAALPSELDLTNAAFPIEDL